MTLVNLTGLDLNDPTPGMIREFRPNSGASGGATTTRVITLIANKLSSVGSGSVDGKGDPLNTPIRLDGTEQDVIDRAGLRSEALLKWKTCVEHNGGITPIDLVLVPPGTDTATVDFTVANAATARGVIKIESIGETVYATFASGDSANTIAAAIRTAINANQTRYWPLVASGSNATVTVSASYAGTRGDHYVNKCRITVATAGVSTTVGKGSVTGGSTDDDHTTAIAALELAGGYYHVSPKVHTSGVTSTDNGLGEHLAAMTDWVSPQKGKEQVLIAGSVGTPSQATTVAISMNKWFAFLIHSEGNDWSPAMLAAAFAGTLAKAEASNRAPNLAGYGARSASDVWKVPPPFAKADWPTKTEIKTLLNNGVTPVEYSPTGKPSIVWHVTTQSVLGSVNDYRSRPGHIASALFDLYESTRNEALSLQQPNIADDPKQGEKPLAGFTTPRDIRAVAERMIDLKTGGESLATLDPSQRDAMKAAIVVERRPSGWGLKMPIAVVRHNNVQHLLFEEVSPSI